MSANRLLRKDAGCGCDRNFDLLANRMVIDPAFAQQDPPSLPPAEQRNLSCRQGQAKTLGLEIAREQHALERHFEGAG